MVYNSKQCQKCKNNLDESSFEILGKSIVNHRYHEMKFKRDEVCRGCRSFEKIKEE